MRIIGENNIQLVRETIAMCLNAWKLKLGTPDLDEHERDNLLFKCFWGAKILLESYGPNPNADPEFMKLLLFMQHVSHVEPDEEETAEKKKETLLDYLT